jgi:DNA-binding FadR family transcriptional regulator
VTETVTGSAFAALAARPSAGRQSRKLSHLIARDLRGMILRGELAQGQPLPSESDLIRAFEVSRDTLREALRILESESLIRVRRGRGGGAVVQRPHPGAVTRHVSLLLQVRKATVGDIVEARQLIEPSSVAHLALRASEAAAALSELHELELSRQSDPLACLTAIVAFDQAVLRMAGNRTIAVVSSVFRELLAEQAVVGDFRGRGARVVQHLTACHADVLSALATSDPAAVRSSWSAYLEASASELLPGDRDARYDVVSVWRAGGSAQPGGGGPETIAASLARDIRARIAAGELVEGDQLAPMRELVVEYGVSRPSIRECLRILEVEGLVDLRTGSRTGARILVPTTDAAAQLASVALAAASTQMIDVVESRLLVEPEVFELVAARAPDRVVADLLARAEALDDVVDDAPAFVDLIAELERQVFAAAGNPALSVALEMIHWVAIRCRRDILMRVVSLPKVGSLNRLTLDRVKECLRAASMRDPQRAREEWEAQLSDLLAFFRHAYGDRLIVDLFD